MSEQQPQYSNRIPQNLTIMDMKVIHASKPTAKGTAMQFGGGVRYERWTSTPKASNERTKEDYGMIWVNVIVMGEALCEWLKANPLEQHDWVRLVGEIKFGEGLNTKEDILETRLTIFVNGDRLAQIAKDEDLTRQPPLRVLEYGSLSKNRRQDVTLTTSRGTGASAQRRAGTGPDGRPALPTQTRTRPAQPEVAEADELGGWEE